MAVFRNITQARGRTWENGEDSASIIVDKSQYCACQKRHHLLLITLPLYNMTDMPA